jgi:hypothetical protein
MHNILVVVLLAATWPLSTVSAAETTAARKQIWAGISVPEPVFSSDRVQAMQINFAVVNDGVAISDPQIADSRLVINGVELKQWPHIISNGPRASTFNALPPGQAYRFGYALGEHFRKPGIYVVRWEGVNFRSRELTFRVLPSKL